MLCACWLATGHISTIRYVRVCAYVSFLLFLLVYTSSGTYASIYEYKGSIQIQIIMGGFT